MERILVIDDDSMTLAVVKKILQSAPYLVDTFSSPAAALESYKPGAYDLVITDYFMPEISGQEVVKAIKEKKPDQAIMVLTASMELETTIELFKHGVQDYIVKPVIPEDLLHRAKSVLSEIHLRNEIQRIEQEKQIIEMESQKIVNWRMLYAYKDITQTEQMVNLLNRTINADGGFAWLDMLQEIERNPDGGVTLDKDLLDLIRDAVGTQRTIFEFLGFMSQIPKLKISAQAQGISQAIKEIATYARETLSNLSGQSQRQLEVSVPNLETEGYLHYDWKYLSQCLDELVINAIKYSPPQTRIIFEIYKANTSNSLVIGLRNVPRSLQTRDKEGNAISGIPYEYSELVFDLFFTIDNFSAKHPKEQWPDGTGLYVVRKLLGRMGGSISNASILDHTGPRPSPQVQFLISLPISSSEDS